VKDIKFKGRLEKVRKKENERFHPMVSYLPTGYYTAIFQGHSSCTK